MIQKVLYPKTKRLKVDGEYIYITEKLDGSNLVFFKKDGELYIAQRNNIIGFNEVKNDESVRKLLYGGLYGWILENGDALCDSLHEGSAICGEWMGMGKIKYSKDLFTEKWYQFAKGNIDDSFNLVNLNYNIEDFHWSFIDQNRPDFLGIVPFVDKIDYLPTKEDMDWMYEHYIKIKDRPVEGFVINYNNMITKYLRMKNGKLTEHFDREK